MTITSVVHWSVEKHGFESVVPAEECQRLISAIGPMSGAGRRGLVEVPEVAALATSTKIKTLLARHLGDRVTVVRAIYFDESAETNWSVTWHQDLLVAVQKRTEIAGFWPWSVKDGTPHVQPPVHYLEQMLTVRLHLDDTDEGNGALRVIPGPHQFGQMSSQAIDQLARAEREVICSSVAGGALLMRPLLLHASRRSAGN